MYEWMNVMQFNVTFCWIRVFRTASKSTMCSCVVGRMRQPLSRGEHVHVFLCTCVCSQPRYHQLSSRQAQNLSRIPVEQSFWLAEDTVWCTSLHRGLQFRHGAPFRMVTRYSSEKLQHVPCIPQGCRMCIWIWHILSFCLSFWDGAPSRSLEGISLGLLLDIQYDAYNSRHTISRMFVMILP